MTEEKIGNILFEKTFDEPRESQFTFWEDGMRIAGITFESAHYQDCCESVFADFKCVKYYEGQVKELGKIRKIEVKDVEDVGFLVFLYGEKEEVWDSGIPERLGILVPCYNVQNGYYSSKLTLTLSEDGETITSFDISKADDIC